MAEKVADLPEECWANIISQIDQHTHLDSLSLVSKQFLSLTNHRLFTLKLSDPTAQAVLPRLLQRFRRLKHIDLAEFRGELNSLLYQIARSGLDLESLNVSNQTSFPANGLRVLGSKMTNLKHLNCSRISGLQDCHLNELAQSFSYLEELDISYSSISDKGIFSLSSKLKLLKKINLSGNDFITDQSLVSLSMHCVLLTQVVIHFCNFITHNGIAKLIRDSGRLNSVSVCGIGVPLASSGFKDSLVFSKALSTIDFSDSDISDELLYSVAEAHFPLKKLILSNCTSYSFSGISFLLRQCQFLVEYLDLEGAYFLTDKDMAEISWVLHSITYINLSFCSRLTNITLYLLSISCPILNEIEMVGTEIGDESLQTNCEKNLGVISLNLAQNTSMGDFCIMNYASVFPNLELLNLSHCVNITEEGIVEVLKRCSKIRHLEISQCSVMKNLLIGFELPKLEVLCVKGLRIDDYALGMIGKRCCRLLQLDLAGCLNVTAKGVKEVVENCKELREINLKWCNNVSADIVPWMVFSRPSLKKIVPPCGFVPTESQRNLFLRHGCLICED